MKTVKKDIPFAKLKTLDAFNRKMAEEGIPFPTSENPDVLKKPVKIEGHVAPNAMVIQPLEGFDGTLDGNPSDLIFRRYRRYGRGGAGILWYESIAISDDGRCNPRQMIIKESTLPEIKRLVEETNREAAQTMGSDFKPYNILQLTHSGRRSVDANWNPTPLAVVPNPYIDHHNSIDGRAGKITFATDEKIEEIIEGFIQGAVYAAECGFDSVDVKICHEYILNSLESYN
jgi:2,4-dienoyl-CoA reductase-like NADH-dependent reductase (Old Yellow Enzyme family)